MKLYIRPKTTFICLLLMTGMIRASFWQWDRHQQKLAYIAMMEKHLQMAPVEFQSLIPKEQPLQPESWNEILRRRVKISGEFDFDHEVVLRNRRFEGAAGVYVLTPLKVTGGEFRILVNRGFVPLSQSTQDKRRVYRGQVQTEFTGLIKEGNPPRSWFAPADPPSGPEFPWVDAWLRVDIVGIARQLPYPLLPVHLEIMNTDDLTTAQTEIVRATAGREELLMMGLKPENVALPDVRPGVTYPVPLFDAVIPPGRHLGYVYEWAIMAVMTLLILIILQLRPPRTSKN